MPSTTRRRLLATLGTAVTAVGAGCGTPGLEPPPNERHPTALGTPWTPPTGSWQFPAAGPRQTAQTPTAPPAEPTVAWHRPGDEAVDSDDGQFVGVADGRIVVSAVLDGRVRLRALALADGTELWRNELPLLERGWFRPGGIADGTVYATDNAGGLLAIDTADGRLVWRRSLREQVVDAVPDEYVPEPDDTSEFATVVTPTPHTLYAATGYGLHGVDADDGTELWRVYLGDDGGSSFRPTGVVVTTDGACVTGAPGRFASVKRYGSPEDEEIDVEHTDPAMDFVGRPMATDANNVALLNHGATGETGGPSVVGVGFGRKRWSFPGYAVGDGDRSAEFATDGTHVFVAGVYDDGPAVFALRQQTGQIAWLSRLSPDDWIADGEYRPLWPGVPAVADDTLLVGYGGPEGGSGVVLALSAADGTVRWRRAVPAGPERLAVVDDTLLAVHGRGGVTALRADGGDSG